MSLFIIISSECTLFYCHFPLISSSPEIFPHVGWHEISFLNLYAWFAFSVICILLLMSDKEGDERSIENAILHQFPLPLIKAANKRILLMQLSQSPCALRYIKETLILQELPN